jgi:hypothetical protein
MLRFLTVLLCLLLYSPAHAEEGPFIEVEEASKAEIEKAWAEVKKPIPISVTGGVYSEDQSAVDAITKGFVRRLNITDEFEISYTYPPEGMDKNGNYADVSYMLNMLMDKTKDGLHYGYMSIRRIHRICRCQDGFEYRLSEEIDFSAYIFSNYSYSRLVELGAEYAQQAYDAIERDLLKDMGYFYNPESGNFTRPFTRRSSPRIPKDGPS